MFRSTRRGMAVPLVLLGITVTSVLVGAMLKRVMVGSRHGDMTYNKKSAYYVAEAGLNRAVKELMTAPFFGRFLLKDFVQAATGGTPGQIKPDQAGLKYQLVRDGIKHTGGLGWAQLSGKYGEGEYEVTLVEHVSQNGVAKSGAPGAGISDPVKATLDHIAVYSKGRFDDPALGETWALVTAKIVFRPEPFIFEYDSNGDGISNPQALDAKVKEGQPVPLATAEQAKMSDLVNHPFLHPDRWAVWGSGNFQSPPPTNVSVIKNRVFYQTVKGGDKVREIKSFDFTGNAVVLPADPVPADYFKNNLALNADRTFVQNLLKTDNKQFVLNFGSNKLVKDTFEKDDMAKDLVKPGQLDITQGEVEKMVDAAAGGQLKNLDPKDDLGRIITAWIDQYTQDLPTRSGKTAYGKDPDQAELQLIEDTSLGRRDNFAENLGKTFKIPAAELDKLNKLIDSFAKGQVQNGRDLLALKPGDPGKPPVAYVDDLTAAQEYYAPVVFPRGKVEKYNDEVPDGNAIPDLNGDKVCNPEEIDAYMAQHPELNGKPPMTTVERYRIGNEFMAKLKGAKMGDAEAQALYDEMKAAVEEINKPPVSQYFTAELSPQPPSFAQMEHTIILKAQSDPRLNIRLKDALREALKWVEVPGAENGETGEVAPVAIAMGLSYSLKWKCFCKDNAETEEETSRETRRSASAGGVAR